MHNHTSQLHTPYLYMLIISTHSKDLSFNLLTNKVGGQRFEFISFIMGKMVVPLGW